MIVSAHDVAAALRARLPGVDRKKLHKLLYYCQGHHLGTYDEPLFRESVSAWDMGPVVGELWYREEHGEPSPPALSMTNGQLNTVGYVVSRYGNLTANDLETLSHGEKPWQRADVDRMRGQSARIDRNWMRDFFAADRDSEEPLFDSAELRAWLAGANERRQIPVASDSRDEIRARLAHG